MYFVRAQVLLGLWSSLVAADYLTGFYPPPIDLTSNNSLVAKSWKELSSVFDACLRNDQHTGPQNLVNSDIGNLTFSMGMFSLNDPGAINLQYHYTAPEVATAKGGTNKVSSPRPVSGWPSDYVSACLCPVTLSLNSHNSNVILGGR